MTTTDANEPEETGATTTAVEEVAPDPHALDDAHAALLARFEDELGAAVLDTGKAFGMPIVRVQRTEWRRAAEVCRYTLGLDFLSFVAGVDWMPAPKEGGDDAGGDTSSPVQPTETTYGVTGSDGRFQVFARVQSTSTNVGITLKVDVDEDALLVQSWVPVYPGADWHERETWEMYGFVFESHPALRHLYLPTGFEGHPLRKDYPLLSRVVKPWPGLVDVEGMPGGGDDEAAEEAS
ncbi:MAG: NADH-quinone oxidoreductase subunit C [Acidimicrobiia bacterium]